MVLIIYQNHGISSGDYIGCKIMDQIFAWTGILKVYQSTIKSTGQYKLICL